jgi:hypothetical protein
MDEPKEVKTPEKEEKNPNSFVAALKKIYNFLWVSESGWSYLAFIIIAFVLLRFLMFPAFLYFSGYSDVAAVVSGSMDHGAVQIQHNFNAWLEFNGFTAENTSTWSYMNGLNVGDVIFVKNVSADEIKVGNIILFNSASGPIIHRVISINKVGEDYFYTTKGDANPASSPMEKNIPYTMLKGKLVNKLPYLGYPKVVFSWIIPWL